MPSLSPLNSLSLSRDRVPPSQQITPPLATPTPARPPPLESLSPPTPVTHAARRRSPPLASPRLPPLAGRRTPPYLDLYRRTPPPSAGPRPRLTDAAPAPPVIQYADLDHQTPPLPRLPYCLDLDVDRQTPPPLPRLPRRPVPRPRLSSTLTSTSMEKSKSGKANWDSAAQSIYMDMCVKEVQANNRPDACLSPLGYDNLIRKFNERTKRNYSRMQLKNRWNACRKEYSMWKTLLQKASGLGRDPFTNTIDAPEEWWTLELKTRPEVAKFQRAPLAEEEKIREVFDACCVTNEHARVPTPTYQGGPCEVNNLDDDSGYEGEDVQVTPLLTRGKGGRKMAMVIADGAKPGSDEHFYASQLLLEQKNRDVFTTFEGLEPSVRLGWLRRT